MKLTRKAPAKKFRERYRVPKNWNPMSEAEYFQRFVLGADWGDEHEPGPDRDANGPNDTWADPEPVNPEDDDCPF